MRMFMILTALSVFNAGASTTAAAQAWRESERPLSASEITINQEMLRYRGYTIRKHVRMIKMDLRDEGGTPHYEDVQYATLSRRGRNLFRFDGVFSGLGNSIQFGLFSFVTNGGKYLLVSQDIFRGGKQWIVALGRQPRILYDGSAWAAGREVDDMSFIDLNKDGTYEVVVPTCIFYGFESLSPAATPLPSIVFKYSHSSKRFLPANPRFADYVLDGIDERKRKIHPIGSAPANMNHLRDVLSVVLDYVFAGRAREAWAFYDEAYKLPNKRKIKKQIRAELRQSPVYRFIYRERAERKSYGASQSR